MAILISTLSCAYACEAPQRPSPPPRRELDKRALYGDASLVPTREGERARHELALAGEIGEVLEVLGLASVRVSVELREQPSVVVVARVEADEELASLEATITELASAIVPGVEAAHVHVWLRPPPGTEQPPASPAPSRPWALALVCLGLGMSLGVSGERLRVRRR